MKTLKRTYRIAKVVNNRTETGTKIGLGFAAFFILPLAITCAVEVAKQAETLNF